MVMEIGLDQLFESICRRPGGQSSPIGQDLVVCPVMLNSLMALVIGML